MPTGIHRLYNLSGALNEGCTILNRMWRHALSTKNSDDANAGKVITKTRDATSLISIAYLWQKSEVALMKHFSLQTENVQNNFKLWNRAFSEVLISLSSFFHYLSFIYRYIRVQIIHLSLFVNVEGASANYLCIRILKICTSKTQRGQKCSAEFTSKLHIEILLSLRWWQSHVCGDARIEVNSKQLSPATPAAPSLLPSFLHPFFPPSLPHLRA